MGHRNGACHSHFIIFNQSAAVVHSRQEEGREDCRKMDERTSVGAIDPQVRRTDGGTDDVTSDGDWKE